MTQASDGVLERLFAVITSRKNGDSASSYTAKLFADRGGNAVVADAAGNVYIADGHVSIYDKTGKQIGTLETPERASGLTFGGPDKRTLFIGARTSLLSIKTQAAGAP